ncbi:MAG: Cys-Xaa-Xaa-Xaa repeat radical SAM target protein [Prevotella sp.]|nr:Cys-Xaa-Xaa-Xaa repeat radical SAM target protein [Prevotella sp.]
MKTKKNEELQSRREFFKKAAKSALPILGTAVLLGMPNVRAMAGQTPMGCSWSCTGSCQGTCSGTCRTGCHATCYKGCYSSSR